MAVAQLYQYCAPRTERHKVAKALVRYESRAPCKNNGLKDVCATLAKLPI